MAGILHAIQMGLVAYAAICTGDRIRRNGHGQDEGPVEVPPVHEQEFDPEVEIA